MYPRLLYYTTALQNKRSDLGSICYHCGWLPIDLVKADCAHQRFGDRVRVAIGGRSAVFNVAESVGCALTWNADAAASVGNSGRELFNRRSFVLACQSLLVVLASVRICVVNFTRINLLATCVNLFCDTLLVLPCDLRLFCCAENLFVC